MNLKVAIFSAIAVLGTACLLWIGYQSMDSQQREYEEDDEAEQVGEARPAFVWEGRQLIRYMSSADPLSSSRHTTGEFRKVGDQLEQERGAGARQRGYEDRPVDRHVREAAGEHAILDVGHGLLEPDAAKSDPVDRAVQSRVMLRPAHEAVRFQ